MTRQCYQDWGYVLYGEYLGMYSDDDYPQHVRLENRAVWALGLMFKHNHYTVNGTAADDSGALSESYLGSATKPTSVRGPTTALVLNLPPMTPWSLMVRIVVLG